MSVVALLKAISYCVLDWCLTIKAKQRVVRLDSNHAMVVASALHNVLAMEQGTALYWAAVTGRK